MSESNVAQFPSISQKPEGWSDKEWITSIMLSRSFASAEEHRRTYDALIEHVRRERNAQKNEVA